MTTAYADPTCIRGVHSARIGRVLLYGGKNETSRTGVARRRGWINVTVGHWYAGATW